MLKPIKRNIYKVEYIEDRHGAVVRYVVADTAVMAIRKAKRKWGSKMRYPTVWARILFKKGHVLTSGIKVDLK